jgi:uncharacterized membrane protein
MNLYGATARTLRYGILVSMAIIVLGLAADWSGHGDAVLWSGVLAIIMTPLFGVAASMISLVLEKDRYWTGVAAVLLTVIAAGIAVAMLI